MLSDSIFWEYLEELPELQTAWHEWHRRLSPWHRFNTFYTHYLRVGENRAKLLECTTSCDHNCLRLIVENTPYDIAAICPRKKAEPVKLKFRDILIYSLRREDFHKALCASLQIKYSGDRHPEIGEAWHLGDYSGMDIYLTYRTAPSTLSETISSLHQSRHDTFVLMTPTGRWLTPETWQLLDSDKTIFFPMNDELSLQPDGAFKLVRSLHECMPPTIRASNRITK